MSKPIRIGACLVIGLFLCIAFASLLVAEEAVGPFHITGHDPAAHEVELLQQVEVARSRPGASDLRRLCDLVQPGIAVCNGSENREVVARLT